MKSKGSTPALTVRNIADIEMRAINWLWKPRMALGKLNMLAGQPGLGKSQITCHLAALVTTGGMFPDGARSPTGNVIFLTCEDDPEDTIRPRLEAAGAKTDKIFLIDAVADVVDGKALVRGLDLSRDVSLLRDEAKKVDNVRLIVIDPISAFLGRADAHKAHEVRGLLAPLASLAAELGAAILMLSHLNKGSGDSNAMSRVTGSGAFIAAARSGWLVEKDPDDEDERRRLLVPLKNNLGDDSTGFSYSLETVQLTPDIETSRVRFGGTVQMKAAELLQRQSSDCEQRSLTDDATEFLETYLEAGAQPSKDAMRAAEAEGHTPKSIRRAREKLRVVVRRAGSGKQHTSTWELPSNALDGEIDPLVPTPAHTVWRAGVPSKGTSGKLNGHSGDDVELF